MSTKITLPEAAEKPLDERVRRSRYAVLGATAELLVERGLGGASVDEIVRRSGVAKTTIYRHWSTREDLLRDACRTLSTPLDTPDSGSLEGDLMVLMVRLARLLKSARWPSVLPSIVDAGERDANVAAMQAQHQAGYSEPLAAVIRRAMTRGELPKDTDAAVLVAMLTGALFYRRWFSREPVTDAFAKQVVRRALRSN